MKRRQLLTRSALTVGVVALSGCTERVLEEAKSQPPLFDDVYDEEKIDLPVSQKFETAEEATLRAEGKTFDDLEEFRAYVAERGVTVETLEEGVEKGERILEVAYADERDTDRGSMYSLGILSGGYAALVASDHPTDTLEASVQDSEGRKFGEFEIAAELAEQYLDGKITAAKYAGTVSDTTKSKV